MIILQYARQKGVKFGFKGFKIEDELDINEDINSSSSSRATLKLVDYEDINMDIP